jgi:hypothetical protein
MQIMQTGCKPSGRSIAIVSGLDKLGPWAKAKRMK